MFQLRRKAVQSVARAPASISRVTKRYSTGQHGKTGDEVHHFAGSSTEHDHHHAGPKAESLGNAFYFVLAAIPVTLCVYTFSRPSSDGTLPGLSKIIDSYSYYKERWVARNTLHTAAIEQAAFDRNLFQSSQGSKHVNLRFPEIFNTGAPHNVSAGQGPRNMDQLVAHYEKLNSDEEERKGRALAEKAS
ncbi:NADH-ubiquinone oxidoreductase 17.8 kDa subunit [Mollisia scopiformis]|uniref:NADH-ubiquinone oxidoreductase 17.8 kDa subunit n=1 Tax=Mollisia scopiformis TaxID=149040 RepID=A0A194WT47_MOLSC|nr:NADH-ubiquinone oxidoreductase 17.8 kDa subunit [Mollisia scopiformis]KUJ11128.1 NADH-ubiquinone oxidoreductase 17.8 kDa subunit [Mollisia scopiformis]